ncbi:MAG: NmrA family NAD(P)-binding protein [Anaerolineales bacterium]|nr:NmrA family NAD(P)-binding protein [Anaerolineales bacterium]
MGAAGKTGRAVLKPLAAAGQTVRAFVRRPEDAPTVTALGALSVISGDLRDVSDVRRALTGAQAVYHLCPNVHPDELAIGRIVIRAARSAGVRRMVYHSVLHPQTERMPHHWGKLRVEQALFESGLDYTILQPAPYMQNLLADWKAITQHGVHTVPYPVETRLSLVDLDDVAAAAAQVLNLEDSRHVGATYELVGTLPLSQTEVAERLSAQLGRPVRAQVEPMEEWEARARAAGRGDYQRATLRAMFDYYARFGLGGSPQVLTWLLGRSPTSLAAFIARALV